MAATALIKFVQGASTPPPGEALIGVLTTNVVASNGSDAGVVSWQWTVIDSPPGSSVPLGVGSVTPTFLFVPNKRGGYHIELRVTDLLGIESVDHRVFQIVESSGFAIPPFDALAAGLNFAGQARGWAKYIEDLLRGVLATFADGFFAVVGDARHIPGKVVRGSVVGGGVTTLLGDNALGLVLETEKAYVLKATTIAANVTVGARAGFAHKILCHVTAGAAVIDATIADAANPALLNGQAWTLGFTAVGAGVVATFTAVGTPGAQTVRAVLNYESVEVGGVV